MIALVSFWGVTITAQLVVQGIIIGFISSACFLLFTYMVRPRIYVCRHIIDATGAEGPQYRFKVINLGLAKMVDVQLHLELVTAEVRDGNMSTNITSLKLTRESIAFVPPLRPKFMDPSHSFAFRIRTFENLATKWTGTNQHLRLYVKAKHPLTGFSRIRKRNFYLTQSRPVKGDFKQGCRWGIDLAP